MNPNAQEVMTPDEQATDVAKPKSGARTTKNKQQAEEGNVLKIGKKFKGSEDRFQPGRAWYHDVHNEGQLGLIRAPENEAKFYKLTNNKSQLLCQFSGFSKSVKGAKSQKFFS